MGSDPADSSGAETLKDAAFPFGILTAGLIMGFLGGVAAFGLIMLRREELKITVTRVNPELFIVRTETKRLGPGLASAPIQTMQFLLAPGTRGIMAGQKSGLFSGMLNKQRSVEVKAPNDFSSGTLEITQF